MVLGCSFLKKKKKWDISSVVSMAAGCGDCVPYPEKLNLCSFSASSNFLFHLNSRKESCYINLFNFCLKQRSLFRTMCLPSPAWSGSCWSAQSDPPTSGLFWAHLKCSVLFSWFLSWCSLAQGWWLLKHFPCVVLALLGQQQRLYRCRGRGDFVGREHLRSRR